MSAKKNSLRGVCLCVNDDDEVQLIKQEMREASPSMKPVEKGWMLMSFYVVRIHLKHFYHFILTNLVKPNRVLYFLYVGW